VDHFRFGKTFSSVCRFSRGICHRKSDDVRRTITKPTSVVSRQKPHLFLCHSANTPFREPKSTQIDSGARDGSNDGTQFSFSAVPDLFTTYHLYSGADSRSSTAARQNQRRRNVKVICQCSVQAVTSVLCVMSLGESQSLCLLKDECGVRYGRGVSSVNSFIRF
jgi:hypothetical protein